MIKLRELEEKDAPLMLEWMHDKDIQKGFKKDMSKMRLEDAINFCKGAKIPCKLKDGDSIHFAIADEQDEYLGTISLKSVDLTNATAEYAISVRKKAQGQGIASKATEMILKKAFEEYSLHRVYLNVLSDNISAIRLYEHCGFIYEGKLREHMKTAEGIYVDLDWYGILKEEFEKRLGEKR